MMLTEIFQEKHSWETNRGILEYSINEYLSNHLPMLVCPLDAQVPRLPDTMSEIPVNVTVDLSRTFGQVFISSIITTALWGTSILHLLFYLRTYTSDPWVIRGYVILLWTLSTLHEILCIRSLWTLFIARFSGLAALANNPPDLILAILVSSLVAFMAQSFFIWRIWLFSYKNWRFLIILVPNSLWSLIASIVYTCKTWNEPVTTSIRPELIRLAFSIQITASVVVVSIAVIMSVLLRKGHTGFKRSNILIVRLICGSIATGTCAAVFEMLTAITLAWPDTLLSALGAKTVCAVYCNTVLANLNARRYIGMTGWRPSNVTNMEVSNRPMEFDSMHSDDTSGHIIISTNGKASGTRKGRSETMSLRSNASVSQCTPEAQFIAIWDRYPAESNN